MLNTRLQPHGFTLVEMVVAMAILAFLLAAALPSYSGHVANTAVRNAAESMYAAAQRARAEAIRRNEPVELVLSDEQPVNAGAGYNIDTLAPSANGRNWVIRAPNQPALQQLIDYKLATESAASKVAVDGAGVGVIQFNGLGETTSATVVAVTFSHQSINSACDLTGAVRCLRLRISTGGQARLCEPGLGTTDPRSC